MTVKTMSIPEAGKDYYGIGRNASYAAARRGDIPTIKVGGRKRVPVRAMEAKLDEALKPADPQRDTEGRR